MFRTNDYNKLKQCIVGSPFPVDCIDNLPNLSLKSKDLLKKLLQESNEDYDELAELIKSFGVKVFRPKYSKNELQNPTSLNLSMLNPRDHQIVIKDKVFISGDHPCLENYLVIFKDVKENIILMNDKDYLNCPSIIPHNDIVYCDEQVSLSHFNKIKSYFPELAFIRHRINLFKFKSSFSGGGHLDASFNIIGKNLAVGIEPEYLDLDFLSKFNIIHYKKTGLLRELIRNNRRSFVTNNANVWYTYDENFHNEKFIHYVNTYLDNWVGVSDETIFDINILSIDKNNVIVSKYNKECFDFFKKHNIEATVCSWRHANFWDGGIHCATLDLERECEI